MAAEYLTNEEVLAKTRHWNTVFVKDRGGDDDRLEGEQFHDLAQDIIAIRQAYGLRMDRRSNSTALSFLLKGNKIFRYDVEVRLKPNEVTFTRSEVIPVQPGVMGYESTLTKELISLRFDEATGAYKMRKSIEHSDPRRIQGRNSVSVEIEKLHLGMAYRWGNEVWKAHYKTLFT